MQVKPGIAVDRLAWDTDVGLGVHVHTHVKKRVYIFGFANKTVRE